MQHDTERNRFGALKELLADYPVRSVYGSELYERAKAELAALEAASSAPVAPTGQPSERSPHPPIAWMYEHDGCLHDPIVTTKRWAKCEEPWNETPLIEGTKS